MKRLAITGAVAALLLVFGLAGQAEEKKGGGKAMGGKAVMMPAEE